MSTEAGDVILEDLNAFIDDELDPERAGIVAAAIARNPDLAEQVALLRADKARLVELYGKLIDQPLPDRLVRAAIASRPSARRRPEWMLAAAAVMGAVLFTGYWQYAREPDRLVAEALAVRSGEVAPGTVGGVSGSVEQLAQASLGVGIRIPDLTKAGFRLVASRTIPEGAKRAVELRYADGVGKLFTVFLHRSEGADRFALLARGKLRVCVWQNDELATVMIGEMSSSAMLRVASLTYADLNF